MAFNVLARLHDYEVRMVQSRTLKSGRGARFMRLESPDAAFTCEVAVWDDDLFPLVDLMSKGEVYDFDCRITFEPDGYSGIVLVGVPSSTASHVAASSDLDY